MLALASLALAVSSPSMALSQSKVLALRGGMSLGPLNPGNFEGGHYITYAKHEKNWYRCDDAYVSYVQQAEVKRANAYLLFYVVDS